MERESTTFTYNYLHEDSYINYAIQAYNADCSCIVKKRIAREIMTVILESTVFIASVNLHNAIT